VVFLPALQKIEGSCVVDGELCALDAHGRNAPFLVHGAFPILGPDSSEDLLSVVQNVRFGSLAGIALGLRHLGFTAESGHSLLQL
jgi:hypothetical protein